MKWTTNQIRRMWLDFWKSKGHLEIESKSLLPNNDPTLIFTNSGVSTLKKYFSGEDTPPSKRLTSSQKSIRTNDIENVGKTSRHHTFFEMLGNFSIGDYFKNESIEWGFELLIKVYKLPLQKLYFTVYQEDKETYNKWISLGVNPKHIIMCSKDRNFWDIGSGPCGPCTEIYYDRGEKYDPKHIGEELFFKDIENDRYVEIWNIVFSQFNNDGKNNYTELIHKNIDTGCGLERLSCILQDVNTNFDIDIYKNVIDKISQYTNLKYDTENMTNSEDQKKINYSYRIISDHLKSCIFCISDGIEPSNKYRGYVVRKLLRRSFLHMNKLNIKESITGSIIDEIINSMIEYYPYLKENEKKIKEICLKEETNFKKTLNKGLKLFNSIQSNKISGETVFKLWDTYGFPVEITQELCKERNIGINLEEFKKLKKEHSELSKINTNIKKPNMV